MTEFATYWKQEIPNRIHSRDIDDGGAPQWHPDFALWLTRDDPNDRRWRENPEQRIRTTRAFRKLRGKFPREYEVLYRTAILNIPIPETIEWLNERAARNGYLDTYSLEDVWMILMVATEKIVAWW